MILDIFFEMINLNNNEIDSFIDKRIKELDAKGSVETVEWDKEGNIYPNWLNLDSTYLPSSYRSMGFKIDKQFIKDFIVLNREYFYNDSFDLKRDIGKIKANMTNEIFIQIMIIFLIGYFGPRYDQEKRHEIYGYGDLNSIGKYLLISEIKDLNISKCAEKSAGLNQLLNFFGIDSSLVVSDANNIGHAYCLVKSGDKYLVADPNINAVASNGKTIYYIFEVNPKESKFVFDPADYGSPNGMKVEYDFPCEKMEQFKP